MSIFVKNKQGYLIIGASIIIASIIVSSFIFNKPTSSLDHCYQKVYKNELEKELENRKQLEQLRKEKDWEIYKFSETPEAEAAARARYICLEGRY